MQRVQHTSLTPPEHEIRVGRARRSPWPWVAVIVAAFLLGSAAFIGVGLYTDRPEFCANCHEMRPYYEAWRQGPHSGAWCVDCHVGQGYPRRLVHKFAVLSEVTAHFRGDTTFPRSKPAAIADRQCIRCHEHVPSGNASGFDHAAHASQGACQACHSQTGHEVTAAVLKAAAVFNPSVKPAQLIGAFATVGGGAANLPGHVTVPCTQCHNMAQTGCQRCHKPRHIKDRPGQCQLCHQPGPSFIFTHPLSEDCGQCHTPSAKHFKLATGDLAPCGRCHLAAGKSWAFKHPAASAECTVCHAPSAKHFKPATGELGHCSRCHLEAGKSWAFKHPAASADCTDCHAVPAQH